MDEKGVEKEEWMEKMYKKRWMDGWMDLKGRKDGWMIEKHGWIEKRLVGLMDEYIEKKDGWMVNKRMMDGWRVG